MRIRPTNDPNYPEDQFVKMQHVDEGLDGTKTSVHYWENLQTGGRLEFKI